MELFEMADEESLEVGPKTKKPGISIIKKSEDVDPEFLVKAGIKKKAQK
jgi:hypothetical protein